MVLYEITCGISLVTNIVTLIIILYIGYRAFLKNNASFICQDTILVILHYGMLAVAYNCGFSSYICIIFSMLEILLLIYLTKRFLTVYLLKTT